MGEDSKNDKFLGMASGGLALGIVLIFLGVARFLLTDFTVFWDWWWISGAILFAVIIFATSLFLKGKVSYGVNACLFILSLVLLFLSWWYSSTRVLVFGSGDDAEKYADSNIEKGKNDKFAMDPVFAHHNTVFVFLGKRGGQTYDKDDTPSWKKEDLEKNWTDVATKEIESAKKGDDSKNKFTFTLKNDNFQVAGKKSAKQFRDGVNAIRFTSSLKYGVIKMKTPVGDAFQEADGIKYEDFEKKYLEPLKKKK